MVPNLGRNEEEVSWDDVLDPKGTDITPNCYRRRV